MLFLHTKKLLKDFCENLHDYFSFAFFFVVVGKNPGLKITVVCLSVCQFGIFLRNGTLGFST